MYGGIEVKGKDNLLRFINEANTYVNTKIHTLVTQLEKYAKGLSPGEIAALTVARVRPVDVHEIRTSRKKFSESSGP